MKQFLFLILLVCCSFNSFADRIRIQGKVRDERKQPIPGVIIYDKNTNTAMTSTDDDGFFEMYADHDGVLLLEAIGCESLTLEIKGKQTFNLIMKTEAVQLNEVVVVAEVKKVIPEPTDIEIKGNYFHIRTRVKVPSSLLKSDRRVVIQTSIYDITQKKRDYLRPLVLDGVEYSIAQERMYNFNIEQDPLNRFIYTPSEEELESEVIPFHDSLYIKDPRGDFRADVLMALEGYNKVIYRDSFAIARGVVNPLRFFEYDLDILDITDPAYIPKAAMQLCNDKGELELTFETGKYQIDKKNPKNLDVLSNLRNRLIEIQENPDASLQSFKIEGIASPDGRYALNKTLAKKRMDYAADIILQSLNSNVKERVKIETLAEVATWEDVARLLEYINKSQAEQVRAIVKKYPNQADQQFLAIRRLPYYRKIIVKHCLAPLRRMSYEFDYTLFRVLTDAEILTLYKKDPSELSRYEFYRLMHAQTNTEDKAAFAEEALGYYPKFLLAAHELAQFNYTQNKYNEDILAPFISKEAPVQLLMNQVLIALKNNRYEKADSIASLLPVNDQTRYLLSIVSIMNGDYESYADEIIAGGGLNEVLLLLARKQNEQAWEKAKLLPAGVAKHDYVRAVAANRLDKISEAMVYMRQAFMSDESLKEIAEVDGDVIDLLEIL